MVSGYPTGSLRSVEPTDCPSTTMLLGYPNDFRCWVADWALLESGAFFLTHRAIILRMNITETIQQKVNHLPPPAQEEVLRQVEEIEERYRAHEGSSMEHPLILLGRIRIEGLPADFAQRHDFYAHGKLEE